MGEERGRGFEGGRGGGRIGEDQDVVTVRFVCVIQFLAGTGNVKFKYRR